MKYKWVVLRIAILIMASYALVDFSKKILGFPWFMTLVASFLFFLMLYYYLVSSGSSNKDCFKYPFSLTKPFYPMKEYPLQYWFLTSLYLMLGGIECVLRDLFTKTSIRSTSVLFLLMGVGIFLALALFIINNTTNSKNRTM